MADAAYPVGDIPTKSDKNSLQTFVVMVRQS